MKKILFIILSFGLLFSSVFAIDFYFTTTSYETNEGIVHLPSINMDFGDEITSSFELVIRDNEDIIYDDNLDNVKINNIDTFDISLSDDNKRAIFSGNFEGNFKISGLYIRTYEDEVNGQIGLNYKGNEDIDLYSQGRVTVDDEGDNDDDLKPLPVKKLSYSLTGAFVLFEWTPSPDLDLTYSLVRLEKDGRFYRDIRINANDTSYKADLNMEDYDRKVSVYAKDIYYLSEATSIEILKEEEAYCIDNMRLARDPDTKECKAFYNTCDIPDGWDIVEDCNNIEVEEPEEEEPIICIQVTQVAKNPLTGECKIFGTPCDVPDGWEKVNTCTEIKLLDKQQYTYNNEAFNTFQTKFDSLVDRTIEKFELEQKNEIIEIRNSIMLILKNFESRVIGKEKAIKKLKKLIKKYKETLN